MYLGSVLSGKQKKHQHHCQLFGSRQQNVADLPFSLTETPRSDQQRHWVLWAKPQKLYAVVIIMLTNFFDFQLFSKNHADLHD